MSKDPKGVKLRGKWTVVLSSGGREKKRISGYNVVCENGKEFLASFLSSAAAAASTFTMRYVGIGTDSTAEAASNTALGTELARHTGTVSYISGQIYRVIATFPSGTGTGAIVEYGLFSSNSAGTMLNRDTEDVITKGANDDLTVYCDLTIG